LNTPLFPVTLPTHGVLRVALALSPTWAWADGAASETPGVSSGAMLQTALGLLLILGLLFLAAYLLRRLSGSHGLGGKGPLKVVGGLIMGTRERIVLVEIGDTWLVIGIGTGQIRTLHTMPKGEASPPDSAEKPFGQWLKQIIEQKHETR
jgi:flagellar protein FliO/FliZ